MLNFQYALPGYPITEVSKELYLTLRENCPKRNRKLKKDTHFAQTQIYNRNTINDKFQVVYHHKSNILEQFYLNFSMKIFTHIKILSDTGNYIFQLSTNSQILYSFVGRFGEYKSKICFPLFIPYTFFSLKIQGDCSVILSGNIIQEVPQQLKTHVYTNGPSPISPRFVYIENIQSKNQECPSICGKKYNLFETQLLWNMCKDTPRKSNEIAIPTNLNLNDEFIYFYNFYNGTNLHFPGKVFNRRFQSHNVLLFTQKIKISLLMYPR